MNTPVAITRAIKNIMQTRVLLSVVVLMLAAAVLAAATWQSPPVDFDKQIAAANAQPIRARMEQLTAIRHQHERWLAMHPADAAGWARLAYLRQLTQGSDTGAQKAQQMSALAAPAVGQPAPQQRGQ